MALVSIYIGVPKQYERCHSTEVYKEPCGRVESRRCRAELRPCSLGKFLKTPNGRQWFCRDCMDSIVSLIEGIGWTYELIEAGK